MSNDKFIEQKKLWNICSPYRENRFLNFSLMKIWFSPRKTFMVKMMYDQFGIRFKMFPIVELTVGRTEFWIRPLFGKFLALKMEGHLEPVLKNIIEQPILIQKCRLILKILNSEIIFRNLFDQKRSFFSDLKSKTWYF